MANKTRTIEVTETINASPERIFPYLTDEDKIVKWFPTKAETDPVVGGHYMLTFEFSDPELAAKGNHLRNGTYSKINAPKELEYSWEISETDVQISLNPTADGTEVKLLHTGWPEGSEEESFQSHTRGWTFFLSNLKSVLENNNDRREDEMWMKSHA